MASAAGTKCVSSGSALRFDSPNNAVAAIIRPARIGQAIVRVRRGRARRGLVDAGARRDLVDAGTRRLAMRAGRPFVFRRRERSPTQQQGRSDHDQG